MPSRFQVFLLLLLATISTGCASRPAVPVDTRSVSPGTAVTRGGTVEMKLLGTPIAVGDPLPAVTLIDRRLKGVPLTSLRGEVLLVSVVPSLDTGVCERQTGLLGEAELPPGIRRVTISRDLPFAQNRFAEESGFKDILYLSDYRTAEFARATGLLVDQVHLLARSVLVVDRDGIVRYIQVVPEMSHLPDMAAALAKARQVLQEQ